MSYENPEVPQDVNVSRDNPVVEFLRLAAGLALCVLVLSAILFFFGGWLARFIPFSTERSWVGDSVVGIAVEGDGETPAANHDEIEKYIRTLSQRLAARMSLPEEMVITAHFSTLDVPNAFATLGGHIVVTQGLYEKMPSENALATVIAHEIAHVKARDPISGVGGAAAAAVMLALFSGNADGLAPYLTHAVRLGYSRQAESDADQEAVAAIRAEYGHAGGAAAVFEVFKDLAAEHGGDVPTLLSTHPADDARIEKMRAAARSWDPQAAPIRPLAVKVAEQTAK
jgi:beta-barrel assembly-enhancing protease